MISRIAIATAICLASLGVWLLPTDTALFCRDFEWDFISELISLILRGSHYAQNHVDLVFNLLRYRRLFVGWQLPKVHLWYTRVIAINVAQLGIVLLAGLTWEHWLSSASLFHFSIHINKWLAGFCAYFIATFVFCWWHRMRHESDFLWRYFHQIHHSPQRLEVITSFYKHPQEMPEMHRVHHQYGYHKNNYGDFVFWDMIFGTYENPKTWSDRCGFDEPLELKLREMLTLRDVHKESAKLRPDIESHLREGDLIFVDIPSFLFRRVAECTRSWTSHVGVAFKNDRGMWVVSESKIPFSKEAPLSDYLQRSADGRFEIRRLNRLLTGEEIQKLRMSAIANHGRLYGLGFDMDAKTLFCSKHVHQIYKSIGVDVGRVQTFSELLAENTTSASIKFWRSWFLGFVPWKRRTVTPASQLADAKFVSVPIPLVSAAR